jgi:DNA-binding transcriptional LysR family regulator
MLERLDLVNLVALHVLIEERHVTRAAKRLGLTQSSTSHRLARLRDAFGDPLFVRVRGRLVPTPRTEAIAAPLADALERLQSVVEGPLGFDARSARFTVALALPDLLAPLAGRLIEQIRNAAPRSTIRLAQVPADLSDWLASAPCAVALAPLHFAGPSLVARPLGELGFAVVARRGHPALRRRLTTARWLEYPHVVVRVGNDRPNVLEQALGQRALRRTVGLEVSSFLAGLHALAGSDLLMNAPTPIIDGPARVLDLAVRDAPIPLPKFRFGMLFHERNQHDATHRFCRDRIVDALAPLFPRSR